MEDGAGVVLVWMLGLLLVLGLGVWWVVRLVGDGRSPPAQRDLTSSNDDVGPPWRPGP